MESISASTLSNSFAGKDRGIIGTELKIQGAPTSLHTHTHTFLTCKNRAFKSSENRSSHHGSEVTTWLVSMRIQVRPLASLSGLRIWHCHELWYRSQMWLGSTLLWLWYRPAGAALIRPLAWEIPYAPGLALKSKIIIIFIEDLPYTSYTC